MNISSISGNSNVEMLISQYMAIERKPLEQMQEQRQQINSRKSIFTELKSKLTALRTAASNLKETGSDSQFGTRTVTSSNENKVNATANGNAVNGNHLIKTLRLAKADTIISDEINTNARNLSNRIDSGTNTFKITINDVETEVNVSITGEEDDNQAILAKIAGAINDSEADVTATVVTTSNNKAKLVLRSNETGSENRIQLSEVSGSLLSTFGLANSAKSSDRSGGYVYEESELDAQLEVDGISITSSSNNIDDVIEGVTINLVGVQEETDDPVQITIESDHETVKENLQDFFEKYNDVISYIREQVSVDPATKTRGALAGDFTFINLRLNLRTMISDQISGISNGNPSRLSEIGIEPDRNGLLSIEDMDKFDEFVDDDIGKISDLFNSENGLASRIYDLLTPFTTVGGIIDDSDDVLDNRIRSIDTRIRSMERQLSIKENNYRRQFSKLQEAYSALSVQQNIVSIVTSAFS